MQRPDLVGLTLQELIVSSRLLVLQSKRLLLHCRTKVHEGSAGSQDLASDAAMAHLRDEALAAEGRYRSAVLKYGAVDSSQYWLVAYNMLVGEAEMLWDSMHRAESDLVGADREEVSKDAARLQDIIDSWRELARTMTEKVA